MLQYRQDQNLLILMRFLDPYLKTFKGLIFYKGTIKVDSVCDAMLLRDSAMWFHKSNLSIKM